MLSATGAAAARTVRRTGRLLALLLLAPFYVAGWGAAAVIVAGRHVRAAVVTGWEDVAGPAPRAARAPQASRVPAAKPDAGESVWLKRIFAAAATGALLVFLLLLALFAWVGYMMVVANG